jgi:hypothetical protein
MAGEQCTASTRAAFHLLIRAGCEVRRPARGRAWPLRDRGFAADPRSQVHPARRGDWRARRVRRKRQRRRWLDRSAARFPARSRRATTATERALAAGTPGIPGDMLGELGSALAPGAAMAAVLIVHRWAEALEDAVARTGGVPLVTEFVQARTLADLLPHTAPLRRGPSPARWHRAGSDASTVSSHAEDIGSNCGRHDRMGSSPECSRPIRRRLDGRSWSGIRLRPAELSFQRRGSRGNHIEPEQPGVPARRPQLSSATATNSLTIIAAPAWQRRQSPCASIARQQQNGDRLPRDQPRRSIEIALRGGRSVARTTGRRPGSARDSATGRRPVRWRGESTRDPRSLPVASGGRRRPCSAFRVRTGARVLT